MPSPVMMCKICHEHPAEVRDRDRPWNPVPSICRECHAKRLQGDIKAILDRYMRGDE